MPFPFTLPTTSSVLLTSHFDSITHPSLPLAATTKRSVLKDALKKHKRLAPSARPSSLPAIQDALNGYLPYLLSLHAGCTYHDVGPEKFHVDVKKPLAIEWRSTLSAALDPARAKLLGLHYDLVFTLSTLAYVHSLLARVQLRLLYVNSALTAEQRTAAIGTAMKHLLEAHSIHVYQLSLPSISAVRDVPIDIQPSTISALASLALAEATLIVVAKDDPYAAAVADDRNDSNTDWMFKAPVIPKVRAHLFARLCLTATEHATSAGALLAQSGAGKLDEDLSKYVNDFRRTARAKAVRFLAIDAELAGKTGEALAWLKGARKELGLSGELQDCRRKGLRGLKQNWQVRREDRKVEKGGEWGTDAGRFEEGRVVEMLETKWERENSTVNIQPVPPFEPLLASMPSGREYHSPQTYVPPTLDQDVLVQMRAQPEPDERAFRGEEADSGEEESFGAGIGPIGAFPGGASNSYF